MGAVRLLTVTTASPFSLKRKGQSTVRGNKKNTYHLTVKNHKIIDEVTFTLTDGAKNDKALNPTDKNTLAMLQFFGDGKILKHHKDGWFPLAVKHSDRLKSLSLEDALRSAGASVDYTTLSRSIHKLMSLGYIEYKIGYWNHTTFKGQLPYFRILKGTIQHLIEDSSCFDATDTGTESNSDIAIAIYKDVEGENRVENASSSSVESCTDIAIAIEKEKEIEIEKDSNLSISPSTGELRDTDIDFVSGVEPDGCIGEVDDDDRYQCPEAEPYTDQDEEITTPTTDDMNNNDATPRFITKPFNGDTFTQLTLKMQTDEFWNTPRTVEEIITAIEEHRHCTISDFYRNRISQVYDIIKHRRETTDAE